MFLISQLYFLLVRQENLAKIEKSELIILGDSHTEYIGGDSIYNFSFAGCTYQLHEKFIKAIPLNGKIVVINVAPHNFSDQYHNRFFSKDTSNIIWRRRFFHDLPKAVRLFKFGLIHKYAAIRSFKKFGKGRNIDLNQKQDLSTARIDFALNKHYGDSTLSDTLEINAFSRITNYLNNHQIPFILVQMPHHPSYWQNIPPRILERYENILGEYKNEIRYTPVDTKHYFDGDHILGMYQRIYLNSLIIQEKMKSLSY